jgi:hypothetical protein
MNTTITKPTFTKPKNKIATFRFTLTPQMELIFQNLEKEFAMLDRTEIVKLGLSNLANSNLSQNSSTNNQLNSYDEAMEFWNNNKKEFRI